MMANGATPESHRLGELGSKVFFIAGLIGLAGLLISFAIAALSEHGWETFGRSYLTAFMFVLSLSLGAFFFTALNHATRAGWVVVLRRFSEAVASNFVWLWILFLPLAACMYWTHMYHWTDAEALAHDELLAGKTPFLNKPFWLLLAAAFFGIWFLFSRFFYNNSVAQDATGDVSLTHRMQRMAPLALIVYVFTQSYASMHWMMSLEPHWFSTMYPVYFFAGTCCAYFSLQIIIMYVLQRAGKLKDEITLEHYQDAGKLLFAFGIVFWAYIAFSQYMLIYYANIPEETGWYLIRQMGGWGRISLLLLVGHFVVPFLILLSKHPKRIKGVIAGIACWMLFMHYIDLYWLIMPRIPTEAMATAESYSQLAEMAAAGDIDVGYGWNLLDLTCLIGVVGIYLAGTAHRLKNCSLIPEQDPRLSESLVFENV